MNKVIQRKENFSKSDPVSWLVGVTATGMAAAMTFLGTSIIAM